MKPAIAKVKRDEENLSKIVSIKKDLGDSLIILGHYYQRLDINRLSDMLGDSYALSAKAATSDKAKSIVFCGVRFMAESAEILRSPDQTVYHPKSSAGCPMADMVNLNDLETAFHIAGKRTGKKVIPV